MFHKHTLIFVLGFEVFLRVTLGRLIDVNYMEEGGPGVLVRRNCCRICAEL